MMQLCESGVTFARLIGYIEICQTGDKLMTINVGGLKKGTNNNLPQLYTFKKHNVGG